MGEGWHCTLGQLTAAQHCSALLHHAAAHLQALLAPLLHQWGAVLLALLCGTTCCAQLARCRRRRRCACHQRRRRLGTLCGPGCRQRVEVGCCA